MKDKNTAGNSRFAKAGPLCFYESEVLNSSFVHRMKFSAENPVERSVSLRSLFQASSLFTSKAFPPLPRASGLW